MRSSFVPITHNPTNEELSQAINEGLSHFGKKRPTLTMELVGPVHREPFVKGDTDNEWCWVSIYEQPVDERSFTPMKYMCAISTRGDNLFAAFVMYALCKKFGQIIFDDAGYIDAGKEFTLAEFEEMLRANSHNRG